MPLGLVCLLAAACTAPFEGELVLAPDADRTGEQGADGPFGVALGQVQTQARLTEVLTYDVLYPADVDSGLLLPEDGGPWPSAVFVQGGFVEPARYHWLARHMASRGTVVLLPQHSLDLALFQADNARLALEDLEELAADEAHPLAGAIATDGPSVVMGHSLGGVTAAIDWAVDDTFSGLAVLASYPAEGTKVEEREGGGPVIFLAGLQEGPDDLAAFRDGFNRFSEPRWMGVIAGMNHYSWTDDKTEADLAKEEPAERTDAETRADAQWALDLWADLALLGDEAAGDELDAGLVSTEITW